LIIDSERSKQKWENIERMGQWKLQMRTKKGGERMTGMKLGNRKIGWMDFGDWALEGWKEGPMEMWELEN
jgi:hypothetical protein